MLTYAAVCAQNLDADFNCFSLSGWTVYRRVDIENGGDCAVPPVYGQIAPLNGNAAPWDFSRFQPGVVVVALGTNDSSYIALGQAEADTFSRKYREFLQQLRGCYPAAAIVCTVGMMNPTSFAHIERAARAFGDENVYTHKERFCRSTHPIAADHKQAGDALSALDRADQGLELTNTLQAGGTRMPFQGFSEETNRYFFGAELENTRAYFERNREVYQTYVKKPLLALHEELVAVAKEIDEDIVVAPNRCMSKAFNDFRYTGKVTPVKTYMYLHFFSPAENKAYDTPRRLL